jgi:hypothetical protein
MTCTSLRSGIASSGVFSQRVDAARNSKDDKNDDEKSVPRARFDNAFKEESFLIWWRVHN